MSLSMRTTEQAPSVRRALVSCATYTLLTIGFYLALRAGDRLGMWGIMAWPLLLAPIIFCAYSLVKWRTIQRLGTRGSIIAAVSAAIWTGAALVVAALMALGLLIAGEHPLFAIAMLLMAAPSAAAIPISALAGFAAHRIAGLN
ncbi:hypothetical protein EDC40_101460 [Aminobacter aminovorans]|uniref:Transmembrane protein n=2 Tax=Phyllobacteriaceae TaxID=69277 RepID=A0A380WRM4_AMIAI|nr:hypothetical protein EDC40_101460 [Aminobacter aminovorans]SUU90992.1 Uncharacterised protein [Aminobacter aminovorans]